MNRIRKNLVSFIIGTAIFGCSSEVARNDVNKTSEYFSVSDPYLLTQRAEKIERYSDNLTGYSGTRIAYYNNLTGEKCIYTKMDN
ncbi:hypothetical protein COU57_05765 [Candidatus Pacearchaeota archaeon CG10_big_fil_rev_8_21_14_0_10_32_14]|nr:MAG: hypothetical protein COU57_05765 [Candidatus Pacearchaeota archaeon CG10_big_fil_rev_8_21_14_0_10_32_14]